MIKIKNLIPLMAISVIFWGCTEDSPLGIDQHILDTPNSPPTIEESNLTDGDDFSVGYYNGNIRSDMVNLEWEASEDENFLAYKIFRALGGGPEIEDISEGFEGGSFPSGWTEYGDYGGWYVTSEDAAEGNYSIRSNSGYYGYEYLEKTISVPQNSDIFISYYSKGINDGNGYLYINGYEYDYWGYDYDGSYWNNNSVYYNTGSNTEIVLTWIYSTENYGYGLLDNIEISGVEGGELSYSLIETFNDKNTSAFWDTSLTHNQYYTYKVATIVEQGTHKVDDFEIKTPLWQAPGNVVANGLSPEIVELNWEDNTESETAFKIYIDTMDVNLWDYVTADSTTANQDDTIKVISGLSETAQYRFSIQATNSWEDETPLAYSSSFEFQFDAPSNLVASQVSGTKAIELVWYDISTLENGFEIERDVGSGFELLTTVGSNTTSYTDTDTTDFEYNATYTYRIRAYNDYSGTIYTDYSNDASVTISELSGIFISFEDGQIPDGWYTGGDANWYITSSTSSDGSYSASSGSIYHNDYSYLNTTVNVPTYSYITISFDRSVSSESCCDFLRFYINDAQYDYWGGYYSWGSESYQFYTGSGNSIILEWRYTKDGSVNSGSDTGWIDNIQVTW